MVSFKRLKQIMRRTLARVPFLFNILKKITYPIIRLTGSYRVRKQLAQTKQRKIVVGSIGKHDPGWIPTDYQYLNLLKAKDWDRFFQPGSLDALLAEHVWEHLTLAEGLLAAQVCYNYLKPGGYIRVAVPDGCHPDPDYIERVRVNGTGPAADDHKVLYTYQTLAELFTTAGFKVLLLEYFDEVGQFHYWEWDAADGTIRRSKRFDPRNQDGKLNYTSLILDAIKE